MRCVRLLLGCAGAAELLGTVLAEGPSWITGEGSALYLLDSTGMLRLTASHGLPDWAHERYSVVDPAGDLPAAMALRLRRPYLLSPERTSTDYPNRNAGMGTGMVAVATLPMVVDTRPLGVLALALAHRGTVPRRDLDVLETLADACGHRLGYLLEHARAGTGALGGPDGTGERSGHEGRSDRGAANGVRPGPCAGAGAGAGDPATATAHSMLSLAVRASGHGAFERDLVTGETHWDAQALRLVGRSAPEGGGTSPAPSLDLVVHPEDLPDVQAAMAEALANGGPYRLRYRVPRRGGGVIRIEETGEVMLDVHRRPVRIAGLIADLDHGRTPGERPPGEGPPGGRAAAPSGTGEGPGGTTEGASAAGARSALLLALTRALSRAVTVRDVTTAVTDICRPAFGAAGIVLDLVDEGRLLPVSHTVYGGERRTELTRLADLSEGVMQRALARSAPLFSEPARRGRGRGPERPVAAAAGEGDGTGGPLAPAAWAVLPLIASGRQVGSCLITFSTERAFGREDRTLYSSFAGILAQSLERARLYDTHHHRATELQRAMLPRTLPRLPGITSAARYLPSTEGMQIGGDWYDLLQLPDGRIGLVIGDVQGHNAEATAVMGQLRSGLRAYATDGHDPAATLTRTSRLLTELDTELFATCLYLTLDPADGRLRAARAGHPPPVRVTADARAVELELPGGPPLGVAPERPYPLTVEYLPPGETLLAYTDGLVEDREEDYDESVHRMLGGLEVWARNAGPVRAEPGPDLEKLADLLTLNVTERRSRPDDVALLLLHRLSAVHQRG
ncbi:SpoIIE family protein phosphatase [Kitasatospora purpeofusca]|uniref:SpoIIE family protein phosphatase n=1 Tax=Kitasatospora purpeofusca TaxID=67352 RepID=UPI002A5AC2C0|nr:SpoIIE family protein phosphatase [Kitasatospora purpeofusca]MDY0814438.1 SpoIIE family protein phosphatase [Kitasatospora purpeofusca]